MTKPSKFCRRSFNSARKADEAGFMGLHQHRAGSSIVRRSTGRSHCRLPDRRQRVSNQAAANLVVPPPPGWKDTSCVMLYRNLATALDARRSSFLHLSAAQDNPPAGTCLESNLPTPPVAEQRPHFSYTRHGTSRITDPYALAEATSPTPTVDDARCARLSERGETPISRARDGPARGAGRDAVRPR